MTMQGQVLAGLVAFELRKHSPGISEDRLMEFCTAVEPMLSKTLGAAAESERARIVALIDAAMAEYILWSRKCFETLKNSDAEQHIAAEVALAQLRKALLP
jgi:hypothetical protein